PRVAFRTRGGGRRDGRSVGGLFWHRLHHLFDYQRRSLSRHHAIVRELLRRCLRKRLVPCVGWNSLSGECLGGTQNGTARWRLHFSGLLEAFAIDGKKLKHIGGSRYG